MSEWILTFLFEQPDWERSRWKGDQSCSVPPSHITQTLTPFLLCVIWKDRALLCNVGKSQDTGEATGSDSVGVGGVRDANVL